MRNLYFSFLIIVLCTACSQNEEVNELERFVSIEGSWVNLQDSSDWIFSNGTLFLGKKQLNFLQRDSLVVIAQRRAILSGVDSLVFLKFESGREVKLLRRPN